jgi:hypothetical protein
MLTGPNYSHGSIFKSRWQKLQGITWIHKALLGGLFQFGKKNEHIKPKISSFINKMVRVHS